jgi:hypothetical protein
MIKSPSKLDTFMQVGDLTTDELKALTPRDGSRNAASAFE